MDLKLDLTVLLPTFNSEKTIKKTLDSISWAKEIIIIDSFSNDSTLNIAKTYNNINIIQHEYINSAKQKNWSLDYCNMIGYCKLIQMKF